ncbi:hypothetical protein CVFO_1344 [Isorropodon fossajaponicum endosymbiont JTNG4]|uniref:hypothetical protein n=1 Tax=Isorropodon fossajaponicum symbiont TaxID=883811 RepID=UPI0019165568|nr:hypothetical protein [Isorropodon fossajaponicum symbiont]BBB24414.1 hypothetical protein CVFO_1344 [Isorropodon fossajaponicum endosymbiont JTNG4]
MRSRLLNTAINEILGAPRLINVKYNADKEVFTARIVASDNAVYYDVVVPVVIGGEAQNFKNDARKSKILIKMNLDGKIKPVNFKIKNPKKTYTAYLLDSKDADSLTRQRSVGIAGIDLNDIKINKINSLKVDKIIESNKQYFRKFEVTVDRELNVSYD